MRSYRASGDLTNFKKLLITECPQLEELPSLSGRSCIEIDFCEKLKKISGIEELPALQWMGLGHCSNAFIRNCIHNLKVMISILLRQSYMYDKPSFTSFLIFTSISEFVFII